MAVDLSSRRVRPALDVLEGMRNGQTLGGAARLPLRARPARRARPRRGGQVHLPAAAGVPAGRRPADRARRPTRRVPTSTLIEARNVARRPRARDRCGQGRRRPIPSACRWPAAGHCRPRAREARRIDAEVARLLDLYDAVADLVLAESVYQIVLGNFDRAARTRQCVQQGRPPARACGRGHAAQRPGAHPPARAAPRPAADPPSRPCRRRR